MKFTVSLKDKKIRKLFSFATDYLDVFVDRQMFIMFSAMSDLFAVVTLPVDTTQDYDGPQIFRVPKHGFFNLLQEGLVSFLCDDDTIYIKFENKKLSHSMKFDRQICSTAMLDDKIKLLKSASGYPIFAIQDLIQCTKILKNSEAALSVSNKIAYSKVSGGLHLYSKTKCPDCAVYPAPLSHLLGVCDGDFEHVYNVKDFIVFSDGIYHVLTRKVLPECDSDIDFIMKQKIVYKVEVNFEHAISLLAKIRDFKEIDLNLRRQELILKSRGCEYAARIYLNYEKSETKDMLEDLLDKDPVEVPVISFPAEVFKNILYSIRSKTLSIVCTPTLVRVSVAPGLMFVTGRGRN